MNQILYEHHYCLSIHNNNEKLSIIITKKHHGYISSTNKRNHNIDNQNLIVEYSRLEFK